MLPIQGFVHTISDYMTVQECLSFHPV